MGFEVVKFSQHLRSSVKTERALRVRYRDGNNRIWLDNTPGLV